MRSNEFITEHTRQLEENLHQWFKEKWVRFGPDGKIRGDCARGSESEGKPKCLPQAKAHALGKKGRASAAARKRREDPNPNRHGAAINVPTKKKTTEGSLNEFAIDKNNDGDDRSKLIGSIAQLLKAGKKVDFYVPGIRGHVSGIGGQGSWVTLKRWNHPYSKINYSLPLDSDDDDRFALKMVKPDYYQVVEKQDLNQGVAEGFESKIDSLKKKIVAKRDAIGLAREHRRMKGQHQQSQREIKLQSDIDELSNQITQLRGSEQGVAEGLTKQARAKKEAEAVMTVIKRLEAELKDPNPHLDKADIQRRLDAEKRRLELYRDVLDEQGMTESCPHCGGAMVPEHMLSENKDACYYKVKASAKVWPSAYASGRLVQCRKKGAANYGNKSK